MTFPVVGSNIPSAYQISNSLRFNDGDSPYLSKSFSTVTNTKKFTVSFWFKPSAIPQSNYSGFLDVGGDNAFALFSDSTIYFFEQGGAQFYWRPQRLFRDCSAWYHIVLACDSTLATQTDRVKIYVNGVRETSFHNNSGPSQNYDFGLNTTSNTRYIGTKVSTSSYYDGYLAEYYQIDGQQLQASDFGEFDEDSGIWKPKIYEGTFGDAGYYLKFNNTGNLGEDSSGNDNTFTPTNLSGTTDVTTDTPTNNFATLNSTLGSGLTLSEGNTQVTIGATIPRATASTFSLNTGKWYCEVKITAVKAGATFIGVEADNFSQNSTVYSNADGVYYFSDGNKYVDAIQTSYGASYTTNDIIGVALNLDDDEITFYKNGTSQGTITTKTFNDNTNYFIAIGNGSSGSSPTIQLNAGNPAFSITSGNTDDNGYGNFEYAPPSGYLALCTQNLATALSPTIDDGSQYFNTVLWSGNSVDDRSITGVGFAPDLVSIKNRGLSTNFYWYDTTRGADNQLLSNATNAESTITNKLQAFESDGFQLGTSSEVNASSYNYVGWSWKANGGTTSSNTDGSITSTVQVNTTAGFSIVTFTGNATAGATVGHGLGVKPDMIIAKNRSTTKDWLILHKAYEGTSAENMRFRTDAVASAGSQDSSGWYRTAPTSSVFYVGNGSAGDYSGDTNTSGSNMVAYCFAEIEGYSKFGSYTGNGSTDGTFIYTGFRPAFVMVKRTDVANNWDITTGAVSSNQINQRLRANLSNAEESTGYIDFISNGFKMRNTNSSQNASGGTYIYMAFAENPFVSSSAIPVVAR